MNRIENNVSWVARNVDYIECSIFGYICQVARSPFESFKGIHDFPDLPHLRLYPLNNSSKENNALIVAMCGISFHLVRHFEKCTFWNFIFLKFLFYYSVVSCGKGFQKPYVALFRGSASFFHELTLLHWNRHAESSKACSCVDVSLSTSTLVLVRHRYTLWN